MRYNIEGFNSNEPVVAVIFAGRINGYEHNLNKIQDIINDYNPIFFCSLNEDKGSDYINKFTNTFNIKEDQINIEKTVLPEWINSFMNENEITSIKPYNMYSMFYHEHKAFNLIEEYQVKYNIKFTTVLYHRADLQSTDKLIMNIPNYNTIYLSDERSYYGVNDRMAYGNVDTMKKYCNTVNNLDTILVKSNIIYNHPQYNTFLNPEMILFNSLQHENLIINKIKYNTNLYIYRNNKCIEFNECNN